MKHLVLGSGGQIGKSLTHYLKYVKKEDVLEFDIVNEPYQDLRQYRNPLLEQYMSDCDIVHFLAYDVGGAKYLEDNQDKFTFINNNMLIMSNTFNLIQEYNKPFLFASSQMSELTHSSYGILKALGEKITKDLGGINIRFWNVYGEEDRGEKAHVITDFIRMAKEDGVIKMRTDGKESRQFLFAEDCSEAIWILSRSYNQLGNDTPYCITSYKWSTILEVAEIIKKLSGCKVVPGVEKDTTQRNAMNEPNLKINQWWQPKHTLEQGITKLYNTYL